jgi:hypothetical protein
MTVQRPGRHHHVASPQTLLQSLHQRVVMPADTAIGQTEPHYLDARGAQPLQAAAALGAALRGKLAAAARGRRRMACFAIGDSDQQRGAATGRMHGEQRAARQHLVVGMRCDDDEARVMRYQRIERHRLQPCQARV